MAKRSTTAIPQPPRVSESPLHRVLLIVEDDPTLFTVDVRGEILELNTMSIC